MAYERVYTKPYPNGWHDLPTRDTLVTAEILDDYDEAFEHIEDYLEDNPIGEGTAADTSYDNTGSGLEADNVQDALDELAQTGGGGTAATTTYDNTESGLEANNVQDAIDELAQTGGGGTAETTTYDNTESGLDATNVQDAIDEIIDPSISKVEVNLITSDIAWADNQTINLLDSVKNYDYVRVRTYYTYGSMKIWGVVTISVDDIDFGNADEQFNISNLSGGGSGIRFYFNSDGTQLLTSSGAIGGSGTWGEIVGIKTIKAEIDVKENYFEQDLLDEPVSITSNGQQIVLSDTIKKFDDLIFIHGFNTQETIQMEDRFDVSNFVYGTSQQYGAKGLIADGWFRFTINEDGDTLTIVNASYCKIYRIIGVKKNLIQAPGEPVQDGLIRWYDALNNTGMGHSNAVTTWTDLTGNGDATLSSINIWDDNSIRPENGTVITDYIYDGLTSLTFECYMELAAFGGSHYLGIICGGNLVFQITPTNAIEGACNTGNWERISSPFTKLYKKCLVDFCMDITNSLLSIYIDGELLIQNSLSGTWVSSQTPFQIGSIPGLGSTEYFKGMIYDVRIYNKALSQKEIRKNCAYDCQKYNSEYGIPLMSRNVWNSLSTAEKKNYGLVSIQDDPTGYRRGVLVNGVDFEPSYIALFDYSTELNHIFTIDETGVYLLMMAIPYGGSGSITLPQSATVLSTVDEAVSNTTRHVIAYIARLHAGDVVSYQMTVGNWGGRIESIIRLDDINTVEDNDFVATADATTTYTLPNDNDLYLVYGLAVSRTAVSRDDTTNTGGEQEVITGDWGVNSVSRVAACKGNQSPNYSFYGYDGGFSAIVSWKIS